MAEETKGPQLIDFENALRQCADNLFIIYQNNGGDESARTVIQLLKNIDRLTPWLSEILEALPDEVYNRLAAPVEQAIALNQAERNIANEQH